jgi:hypothetical protein
LGAEHEKTPPAEIRVSFREGQGKPFLNFILRMKCENLTRGIRVRLWLREEGKVKVKERMAV